MVARPACLTELDTDGFVAAPIAGSFRGENQVDPLLEGQERILLCRAGPGDWTRSRRSPRIAQGRRRLQPRPGFGSDRDCRLRPVSHTAPTSRVPRMESSSAREAARTVRGGQPRIPGAGPQRSHPVPGRPSNAISMMGLVGNLIAAGSCFTAISSPVSLSSSVR